MKFGRFDIFCLSEGLFKLTDSFIEEFIGEEKSKQNNEPKSLGRLLVSINIVVCLYDKNIILCDTGIGTKHRNQACDIPTPTGKTKSIKEQLNFMKIRVEDVTHVLLTIILVDLFRDYFLKKNHHKKYLTLHTLFIAGVAALLPDIDLLLGWFFKVPDLLIHGGIFHTPIFALIFLIPGLILWKNKKHKLAMYFFVITFGILFHLLLDFIFTGSAVEGVMLFWPFSSQMIYGFISYPAALMTGLDAILLLGWLYHEEKKHKIKDFI